jgi:Protein of unknown function (DUF2798)
MSKLSSRWWRVLFPGVVAFGMALFMSGVITAFNTGLAGTFLARWAKAFAFAFPLAWAAAALWAPIAMKITARFVTPPRP